MKFSLTIEVPDDTTPGRVQGCLIRAAVDFADTRSFMPMDVDGRVNSQMVVTDLGGHRTTMDWTVHRVE